MIASLPMYDLPQLHTANDQFWQAIRAELGFGPDKLTRDGQVWDHWLNPELVLSQTCGYPYRARLHELVTLVGTPDYGLPGCPPGYYNSVFVVRRDDHRHTLDGYADAVFAYNEPMSQSGWAAPMHHAEQVDVSFRYLLQTGGHHASALAVAQHRADIAAIDALTWRLLSTHEDFVEGLKELERTTPTPVLPYISAKESDRRVFFSAVQRAIKAIAPEVRDMLSLKDIVDIPPERYLEIPTPSAPLSERHRNRS